MIPKYNHKLNGQRPQAFRQAVRSRRGVEVNLKSYRDRRISIIYNGSLVQDCPQLLFRDARAGQSPAEETKPETGRGTARFFLYRQVPMVLKHYHRGGLIGRVIRDSYLQSLLGFSRMRREFTLLLKLRQLALPVPEPVAFRHVRTSPFTYRGDLITRRIPAARTLSDLLAEAPLTAQQWEAIGATIGRFHARQVYHADLNASNILMDAEGHVHLIDFDKGAIRLPGRVRWKAANLRRLKRSLDKLASLGPLHFSEPDWQALQQGYHSTTAS